MKRDKLEEYIGKKVKVTLFDDEIVNGELHKTGEEQFKNDANLYIPYNYYFVVKGQELNGFEKTSCIFKSSHVKKLKTLN